MIAHIRVRADFVAASRALWQARPGVVVQARAREEGPDIRVGFTATKKIGNAVARNRAKRRLREAARLILPQQGKPGHDYVFVARATTGACDWQALLDDVKAALIRLDAKGAPRFKKPADTASPPLPDRLQDKAVR